MNKKVVLAGKIAGIVLGYFLVFFLAAFSTVSLLVKGDEVMAPDLLGKPLREAYAIAANRGIYLKKVVGDFGGIQAELGLHPFLEFHVGFLLCGPGRDSC